jgi:hypothetical protein
MARRASSTGFSVRWTIAFGLTDLTGHTSGTLGTAYMEHHAAAVALISRIQVAVANHDLAPDPEAIDWGTTGSMEKTRHDLQAISDWLFGEGEYAE